MRRARFPLFLALALAGALAWACGSSKNQVDTSADAAATDDAATTEGGLDDGGLPPDSSVDDVYIPPVDAASAWDGSFKGPLTCTTPGAFKPNWSTNCGTQRWSVKTGTDNGAAGLSLLPQLTTVANLITIPAVLNPPFSSRAPSGEKQVYALKDVKLVFARLEDDSDYHLVVSDGVIVNGQYSNMMITEIPYPGGCTAGSAWQCEISRARAQIDNHLALMLNKGHVENLTVSLIGVGFWDPEHGQYGAAPNTLELHPVLAFCFGAGCDPTQD